MKLTVRPLTPDFWPALADLFGKNGARSSITWLWAGPSSESSRNSSTWSGSTLEALKLAGEAIFDGKVLIDVSNPLDFSRGMPPFLTACNTDSLGEQIQRALPRARVVKTLNTTTASVMVDPAKVAGGDHDLFVSGNDADAKARVTELLKRWFGWRSVIDLGDITSARGAEMILPIWVRLWGALGTPMFNFKISR